MEVPVSGHQHRVMPTGATLLELAAVLALLGVLTGLAAPGLTRYRDRALVHVAREDVIAMVSTARRLAVERGSATLHVRADPASVFVASGADTVGSLALGPPAGPSVELGAGRATIELVFDGLGLGRFASATIRLQKGDVEAEVVISAYGRVRRR